MKDEPPLRVPDPSATIPDFGPRPDLSKAPNLAALMGPPSPMVEERDQPAGPPPDAPSRPSARRSPPPPPQKTAPPAPTPSPTPKPRQTGWGMYIAASLGLAVLAGLIAFTLTLLIGVLVYVLLSL